MDIRCGAVLHEPAWPPGLGPMEPQRLEKRSILHREP